MVVIEEILKSELDERKALNEAYSLRSFARFLGISPTTLSQVISGKRSLGRNTQDKVLLKLGYQNKSSRALNVSKKEKKTVMLEEDVFELIGNWHYFAILSLGEIKGSKADPRWIAKRIGITVPQANHAMTRLSRLKIIEIGDDGSFFQVAASLVTSDEVPSAAIQEYHKSTLKLAQSKIEELSVEEREFRCVTIAGNSKKIKKAKEIIKELKDMVVDSLETGTRDEVYQLSIQLFPLK